MERLIHKPPSALLFARFACPRQCLPKGFIKATFEITCDTRSWLCRSTSGAANRNVSTAPSLTQLVMQKRTPQHPTCTLFTSIQESFSSLMTDHNYLFQSLTRPKRKVSKLLIPFQASRQEKCLPESMEKNPQACSRASTTNKYD